jgi:hypothetical protein
MLLLSPTIGKLQFIRHFIFPMVYWIGTPRFQRFVIDCIPSKRMHVARDVIDVLHKTSVDIFNSKKKAMMEGDFEALAQEAGRGKDIISVLST